MLYLQIAFGNPFAFANGSAAWGRTPTSPFVTIGALLQRPPEGWWVAMSAGHLPLIDWLDFLAVMLFLSLGLILLHQKRWGEGVFVL